MTGRALMTPDELKIMPKDTFIVTRTGVKPLKTLLRLFFEWGIELDEPYEPRQPKVRKVAYANRAAIEDLVRQKYGSTTLQRQSMEMLRAQRKAAAQQASQGNAEKIRKMKT